jgi:hypothetical protein
VAGGTTDDDAGAAINEERADEVLRAAPAAAAEGIGRLASEHIAEEAADRVAVEVDHVTRLRTAPS